MLQLLQPKTEGQKASQISMNHYIDLHLTHFLKHLHQKTTFSNDIITSVIFVSLLHEGLKSYANLKQSVRVIDQNIKFCVLFKLIPFCPSPPPPTSPILPIPTPPLLQHHLPPPYFLCFPNIEKTRTVGVQQQQTAFYPTTDYCPYLCMLQMIHETDVSWWLLNRY